MSASNPKKSGQDHQVSAHDAIIEAIEPNKLAKSSNSNQITRDAITPRKNPSGPMRKVNIAVTSAAIPMLIFPKGRIHAASPDKIALADQSNARPTTVAPMSFGKEL